MAAPSGSYLSAMMVGAQALPIRPGDGPIRHHAVDIRLFFGPVPALLTFLSLPLLISFQTAGTTHAETLERLRKKRGGKATGDK